MKSVYRKSALDKIASVDQLDKVLKVTSPMSWLALLGVTGILIAVGIWSFIGELPSTVTAPGMIVSATTPTNSFYSPASGTVQDLAAVGSTIREGTEVLQTQDGAWKTNLIGTVSKVLVERGTTVNMGTELFRVTAAMTEEQRELVVCYVPDTDVDKIERGMQAYISLVSQDSNSIGHMYGRVINIDNQATSLASMRAVVGEDNGVVSELNENGRSVRAVTIELVTPKYQTSEQYRDYQTVNGYIWSNEKGAKKELSAPQRCSVKIITERVAPITKLFVKLKEILNGGTGK